MSVTTKLNSKSNIKQVSRGDLPVVPRQPVLNRYAAESTSNQTVINLGFMVDTVNNPEAFLLTVDGKLLTPGSTNDYTFTNVDGFGMSSQVTLTQALASGLNIQAIKLGLKKETEMLQDGRFVGIYDGMAQGFQPFVSSESKMVATTTTGTPVPGTFYSQVQNRSSMVDLTRDLGARMGINRISLSTTVRLQDEFGPNGETVYSAVNDLENRIRFVGIWNTAYNASGQYPNSADGFVEITFYGTGLNLLTIPVTGLDYRYTVDGGSESANFITSSMSTLLDGRNASANVVVSVVQGLTLGVHTVKIRHVANGLRITGFEILNASANVIVNPGVSYNQGKKYISSSQVSAAYNSVATGTRGGRVVIYQNADGSIGRAWRAANLSQLNLNAADHSNEEIARVYNWREFGASRSDDFSTLSSTGSARAFTLDDGTTTLVSTNVVAASVGGGEGLNLQTNSNFLIFTFVGTGLDVRVNDNSSLTNSPANAFVWAVDGVVIGNHETTGTVGSRNKKIVSGLPYGTHVVYLGRNTPNNFSPNIQSFTVYQPKKPTIPSGAVELADYNVMANYDSSAVTSTTDFSNLPQGVLFKANTREHTYVGANWNSGLSPSLPSGFSTGTLINNNQPGSYTFFGTGVVLMQDGSGLGTYDFSVSIDGALNSSGVNKVNVTNLGSGSYRMTGGSGTRGVIEFTGLPLGLHTVSFQRTAGTGNCGFSGMYVITPIHSHKMNSGFDVQNTMAIGSQGISDNRTWTPIKDSASNKNISQAVGISSNPTTTSTAPVIIPDMSVTHFNKSGKIRVTYMVHITNTTNQSSYVFTYIDGESDSSSSLTIGSGSQRVPISVTKVYNVTPGMHKIDLFWSVDSGQTVASTGVLRSLTVEEA